jgi:arabinofuranan 3-O-arabinosyltransferase
MKPGQVHSETAKRILAGCGGVVIAYVAALAMLAGRGEFLVDLKGHPLVVDYLEVWVAGQFVLHGKPTAPYDWHVHHAAQVTVAGHPFAGFLGWHYPPLFLFVAAALAMLPYISSFIAWICATALVFAGAIWRITGRYEAALVALAMPAAFGNALVGQNGFVTAAILGAGLLTLETRPWLAGFFIAVLSYKPQFGLLFPIVLLFDRNWRALASASIATLALLAIAWLAFGTAPFAAFIGYLPGTANAILGHGTAGFEKLQSIYGLMRWLGADGAAAWVAHGMVTIAAAFGALWLWKQPVSYAAKAAAVATAVLIATPYLYLYDFPMLAVPFAFLYRDRAFDRVEIAAIIAANLMMLLFVWTALPIGPLLTLVPAALIVRRVMPVPATDVALQRA